MTEENMIALPVYAEIQAERDAQVARWGNTSDDTNNAPNDWVSYISHYATNWFGNQFPPYATEVVDDFRTSMIKTAALAIAAIESIDRQRAGTGKTFYED